MSQNQIQRSPAPPGAMVEVDITNIDEGKLLKKINATILSGLRELNQYEKEAETKGTLGVSIQLKFARVKGSDTIWGIHAKVSKKLPEHQNISAATEKNGHLLCQPVGTNEDPEQQVFFDAAGRIIDTNGNEQFIDQKQDQQPLRMAQA